MVNSFQYIHNGRNLIAGIGSALIDILIFEDEEFIEKTGAAKGGMTYVDKDFAERTLAYSSNTPDMVPGGSACNTIVGVGKLGGAARFVGKCGIDKMGNFFENDLKKQNVEPALLRSDLPTGRVLSIITPDAQRSMFTYLGASAETMPQEITAASFENAAIVHIEGYLLHNLDLIMAAVIAAKAAGAKISIDLASYTVVEESKDDLQKIIADYVDILIANEDEIRVYTGIPDEIKGLKKVGPLVDIAILNVGSRGSFIHCDGKIQRIYANADGAVVDTTGAGDLWASGFLFGLVNGLPLKKCGELAAACGYEVCQVTGTKIPDEGWQRIKKLLA